MTPQEIQSLINEKIAGQGSAVDVGGALPQILSGILELAKTVMDAPKILTIKNFNGASIGPLGKGDFALALGISVEELESFMNGGYPFVKFPDAYNEKTLFNVSSKTAVGETYTYAYLIDFSNADDPKISANVFIVEESSGYSIGEY